MSEHTAIVGCMLQNEKGKVFAVTNRHVTGGSGFGQFYMKGETNEEIVIGKCPPFEKVPDKSQDIDIFEVDPTLKDRCSSDIFDGKGRRLKYELYDGKIEELYDKSVFKCLPCKKTHKNESCIGKVASFEEHAKLESILDLSKQFMSQHFLVKDTDGIFAVEGDSGTAIAIEKEDGHIELVGLVCCGKMQDKTHMMCSTDLTVCLFLTAGLGFLSTVYGQVLQLFDDRKHYICGNLCKCDSIMDRIQAGTTIFFKTPEKIEPYSFILFERLMTLFCLKRVDMNIDIIDLLQEKENYFIRVVNDRRYVASGIYELDNGDQYTLYHSYKACHLLHSESFGEAELHLKMACRSLRSGNNLWLLCKLVSFTTWYCLGMNQLHNMKTLLDESILEINATIDFKSVPRESLPYQYYFYSRYFMKIVDKENSIVTAKTSLDMFEANYTSEQSVENANRLIISVCQYASAILCCGERFEFIDNQPSSVDIATAERCLKIISPLAKTCGVVQKTDFHLFVCDLEFCKKNFRKAHEHASKCLKLASASDMKEEKRWADARIEVIKKLLQ